MKVIKSGIAAIAFGLMVLPVASHAAVKSSQTNTNRVVITYSQDDLKSASGRSALEKEIRSAATLVCGEVDYGKTRSLQAVGEQRSCYHEAVADALTDLGNGQLQVSAR